MKNMIGLMMVVMCIALAMPNVFALASCVTMSNGGTSEINTAVGVTSYVSLRVYNSASEGTICDVGNYTLKAEILDPTDKLNLNKNIVNKVFDYSFGDNNFNLNDKENKQILLTLTPKLSGDYVLKLTATRNPQDNISAGASIVSTTTTTIKAHISATATDVNTNTLEVPFWTTHKSCPDGLVIEKTAECAVQTGENVMLAKDDSTNKATGFFGFNLPNFDWETLGIIVLIVVVMGGMFVMTKHSKPKENKTN